jgi:hypothetical protein
VDFTASAPQYQVEQVPRVSAPSRGHDRRQRQAKPDSPEPIAEGQACEEGADLSLAPADPVHQVDLRI